MLLHGTFLSLIKKTLSVSEKEKNFLDELSLISKENRRFHDEFNESKEARNI